MWCCWWNSAKIHLVPWLTNPQKLIQSIKEMVILLQKYKTEFKPSLFLHLLELLDIQLCTGNLLPCVIADLIICMFSRKYKCLKARESEQWKWIHLLSGRVYLVSYILWPSKSYFIDMYLTCPLRSCLANSLGLSRKIHWKYRCWDKRKDKYCIYSLPVTFRWSQEDCEFGHDTPICNTSATMKIIFLFF